MRENLTRMTNFKKWNKADIQSKEKFFKIILNEDEK